MVYQFSFVIGLKIADLLVGISLPQVIQIVTERGRSVHIRLAGTASKLRFGPFTMQIFINQRYTLPGKQ